MSFGRGGWRRSNYFYPTRKIFMKQNCLDIFLIELTQTDKRDNRGVIVESYASKSRNRYLEEICSFVIVFTRLSLMRRQWSDLDICGAGDIPAPGNRWNTHIMSLTNRAADRTHGASRKYFRISKLAPVSLTPLTNTNMKDCVMNLHKASIVYL